ncbi:hypothetical protein BGAPBR_A0003 (plasmid) [Borreliella garinii PBr]|uniref:Uncharacterized protein n=1 Tax=Borreliella garinii PBr TaxID=498743 RepID=B8F1H6_BORGR|nr:hypothetical protein BGAPBR_A0003 [Borreliella garinii PBr]
MVYTLRKKHIKAINVKIKYTLIILFLIIGGYKQKLNYTTN